jgi:chemotaxis protein methyltransferase CheR/type IV pilus assembly protein PilK
LCANSAIRKPNFCDSTITKEMIASNQAHWQIVPSLQQYVSFALHNIIKQKPPTPHLQNVIICQNMLLYFRKFDQRDVLARLSEQCALGGYIILAPGEALFWRPSNMRRIAHPQVNVWQKINA